MMAIGHVPVLAIRCVAERRRVIGVLPRTRLAVWLVDVPNSIDIRAASARSRPPATGGRRWGHATTSLQPSACANGGVGRLALLPQSEHGRSPSGSRVG